MSQSMREALDAAFDAVEDEDTTDAEAPANDTGEPASAAPADDSEQGTEDVAAAEGDSVEDALDKATPSDEPADKEDTAEAAKDDAADGKDVKAPVDWGPEVREEWKGLPKSVRDHINAREQHINQTLQDGAQNRKLGENFLHLTAPYKAIMDAEGARSPLEAVEGLFKTVGTLRMGSPDQKAQMMAQLISVYGIDINMLDTALVGGEIQPPANPADAALDAKLAPINTFIDQFNAQQNNNAENEQIRIGEDINKFAATAEFFNDVRVDMADFLDAASRNGSVMTLQQAYDKACAMHQGISGVISKRASDKALLAGNSSMASKRNAAASINGSSTGPGGAKSTSLRGDVEAAFAEHS